MPKMKYLHNPRCSKSRQALNILNELNVDIEIIEYLKQPLTREELNLIFTNLGIDSALEMMRPKEAEFAEAGLSKSSSNDSLLDAMVKYPKLIERPILYSDSQAVIGRPPEKVKGII
ncbi:MAG: arsenate reductase (glutaredoxin) [Pseudomonadota bacterium]